MPDCASAAASFNGGSAKRRCVPFRHISEIERGIRDLPGLENRIIDWLRPPIRQNQHTDALDNVSGTSKYNLANFKCVLCAKALKLLTWLESLCMMSQKKLVYRPRRSPLLLDIRIR